MKPGAQAGTVRQVATTRIPTQWGLFQAIGFEREILNGDRQVETAIALVLGEVTEDAPLLRIHSQCFTGEILGSLRCDCGEQLEIAMRAISSEGRGLLIYEYQEGRGIGLLDNARLLIWVAMAGERLDELELGSHELVMITVSELARYRMDLLDDDGVIEALEGWIPVSPRLSATKGRRWDPGDLRLTG